MLGRADAAILPKADRETKTPIMAISFILIFPESFFA